MNPKLLQQITVDANLDTFGFEYPIATPLTVTIDSGTYESILEVLANLDAKLKVVSANFSVSILLTASNVGFVRITRTGGDWQSDWGATDTALRTLLGFAGTETTQSANTTLTATRRHLRGWYSPVGVEYPGIRRRIARRYQDCEDGGALALASGVTHQYVDLLFDACLETQLEPYRATTDDDGYGGTVDWTDRTFADFWIDVADKPFRYYEDAADGTVADAGDEGDEYWTCQRTDEELSFEQLDPDGYTYFSARLPVKRTGG